MCPLLTKLFSSAWNKEQLSLSNPSIAASEQGAYIYIGHGVEVAAGTPAANELTENEDLTITGAGQYDANGEYSRLGEGNFK